MSKKVNKIAFINGLLSIVNKGLITLALLSLIACIIYAWVSVLNLNCPQVADYLKRPPCDKCEDEKEQVSLCQYELRSCYDDVNYYFAQFNTISFQVDEMQEKIDAFNCESEVSINDGKPTVSVPNNNQSCMYTACMENPECCDY